MVIADTRTVDGVEVDGFVGSDGVIYISKNNKSPLAFVFKHELAHFCERAGQKYQDFVNAVRKSATFMSWLKQKGMTELEYNSSIRRERADIGQDPGERGATHEIMGNFVGDMMFGDDTTLADRLIGELKPKERRSVREFLRDFFEWVKGRFTGKGNDARTEIHRLEKMFGEAFRTAVNVEQNSTAEQFAYVKRGKKANYIVKTPFIDNLNQSSGSTSDGGSSVNSSVAGYGTKNNQIQQLDKGASDGRKQFGGDRRGNNQGSGTDWQGQDVGTEQFSYNPQNDRVEDVFEHLRNGEISLNEAEKLPKKPENDNPVKIANTKKEDMSTTPKLDKKATGKVGDGWQG